MNTLNVVESIFMAALEKETPEARAAYLAQACAGDANLRHCVERLLNAHARADSIIPAQAPGLPATHETVPIEERPGSVIGPYKLLQQLGEGGFGVVFMAEQEQPVRRKVALKIIKPGMDSRQILARFEAERQALALMDHPNIARVLDGGTTASGRPYFVMELVKGVPITEFCDQNRLTPRQRLELFIPVCQAVQHAHQKGIIHRDLKPSNVLVTLYDERPVPKVIDFGVAKAIEQKLTEQTLFTRVGQVVGTLEYMSPEQASLNALDVDTRADIYGLGVLLYELLTGTTPLNKQQLEGMAFLEMLRLIREVEPPRPSTRLSELKGGLSLMAAYRKTDAQKLPKLVAGELDWIAMKALDKNRTRRYETASALAADVRCYLSDEPIEARPPSAWYRLGKVARRYRAAVAAGSLVAAALLLGTVVAWLFAVEAGQNAAWALKEKDHADKQTELAEAREKDAAKINADLLASEVNLRHALNVSDMQLIQVAWDSDNPRRVSELLKAQLPRPGQEDLRHFEWHYWNRLAHHGAHRVVELEGGAPRAYPEFSPDQGLLASVATDQDQVTLRLWDTKTGKVVRDLKGPVLAPLPAGKRRILPNADVVFSPDGKSVAAIITLATGPVDSDNGFLPRRKGEAPRAKASANGTAPGSEGGPGSTAPVGKAGKGRERVTWRHELWVWATDQVNDLWHKPLPPAKIEVRTPYFQFHRTGKSVAVTVEDPKTKEKVIHVLDARKGTLLEEVAVPDELKRDGVSGVPLALSPDWKRLLLEHYPTDAKSDAEAPVGLVLWDLSKNKPVWQVAGPTRPSAREDPKSPNPGGAGERPRPSVRVAAFSLDGTQLAVQWYSHSLNEKSELCIYDAADGKVATPAFQGLTLGRSARQIEFSPDGKDLIARGAPGTSPFGDLVPVWDTATGKMRHKVPISARVVHSVSFGGGGQWLAIAHGKTVQVWPVGGPTPFRVSADSSVGVGATSLSADGRRLAVSFNQRGLTKDGISTKTIAVRVLDTTNGKELLTIKDPPAPVLRLRLSKDGSRLLLAQRWPAQVLAVGKVEVWNVDTGEKLGSCEVPTAMAGGDQKTGLVSRAQVAFSADGRLAAFTYLKAEGQRVLAVRQVPSGKPVAERTLPAGNVADVQFSPDGRFLIYQTNVPDFSPLRLRFGIDRKKFDDAAAPLVNILVNILDLEGDRDLSPIPYSFRPGPTSFATWSPITPSPDSKLLVLRHGDGVLPVRPVEASNGITVLDLAGKVKHRLQGHSGPATSVAFSPDGKRLASLAVKSKKFVEIKLWDMHNGQEVLSLTGPAAASGTLQFSADGHRLFLLARSGLGLGSDYELHTWDATPLPGATP